ncbi:hypothetical protein [Gimesia chilikensis]|uniref:hypothetical protein n=1 Tax=Gimesia chilikensis TaxID=2605989 RepID=UPI00118AE629|nr:hypothetical protein [Gimesia chilikensis]QDT84584.1 hypothetical protein MalM14_22440 [Gimesia chilikensis]
MAKITTPESSNTEPAAGGTKQEVLKEITPLGMTAEQMKKSNPEAVKQMEEAAAAKAKAEAKAESDKALDEMKAAFPEDLDFAIESHKAGLSVNDAKAKRYDEVAAKVKTLETENADLKKNSEKLDVTFGVDNDESGEAGAKTGDDEWQNEAAKIWNKDDKLQSEFSGNKTAFFAYYKKRPHEFK